MAIEELTGVCLLLWWVDRLVMDPMLEEYWVGLKLGRIGEANFDSGSSGPGLKTCIGRPMSDMWGLEISGSAGGLTMNLTNICCNK